MRTFSRRLPSTADHPIQRWLAVIAGCFWLFFRRRHSEKVKESAAYTDPWLVFRFIISDISQRLVLVECPSPHPLPACGARELDSASLRWPCAYPLSSGPVKSRRCAVSSGRTVRSWA